MKVIYGFIVFNVHHKQHIFWGQTFALWRPKKIRENWRNSLPKLLNAKNWKKTPDDNTVFGSQIKG
jgi:hypothetical protein